MNTLFPRCLKSLLGPALLLAGSGAFAQGIGIGTTTPTAKLDVNGDFKVANVSPGTTGKIEQTSWIGGGSSSRIGQSFTLATGATLTSIGFAHYNASSLNGTLRIYQGDGTGGTVLYTQSVLLTGSSQNTLFSVSLASPVTVPAGIYTFQFDFGTNCGFYVVSGNPYPGGRQYSEGYNSYASHDLGFEVGYNTSANVQTLYATSTGNVGIGTTAPGQRLEVAGNVQVSGPGNGIIFPDGTRQTTSAVTAASITVSSPLSGSGTAASPLTVATASASQSGVLSATDYSAFSNKFTLPSLSSGSVLFSNGSSLDQNNGRLYWDNAAGRLGVGTATPFTTLAVNGDFSVGNVNSGTPDQIVQAAGPAITSAYRLAQSFIMPQAASLTSVSFRPSGGGAISGMLRIVQGDGPSGTQVHSQPFSVPAGQNTDFVIPLSTPVAVGASQYSFVLEASGGSFSFNFTNYNSYNGGVLWRDGYGTSTEDLTFTVRYRVGATNGQTLYAGSTGNVGIGTASPSFKLDVNGAIRCVGAVNTTSDARLKQQVRPLTGALARVQALRGVRYTFRQSEFPALNLPAGEQIGVLAQEVEAIFPELVSTDANGYKAVNYAQLTPVLIEALKEQQRQLGQQQQRLEQQQAMLQADHADLLTLRQQVARLLAEQPTATAAPATR